MAGRAKKTSPTSKQPVANPATQLQRPEEYAIGFAIAAILLSLVVVIMGCPSSESYENARARGMAAGREDGQRAGEAKRFRAAFEDAEEAAYSATLTELRLSGVAQRSLLYCLTAIVVGFLIGFASQYMIFYLLRRPGFVSDIDWIVLSPEVVDQLRSASTQEAQVVFTEQPLNLPAPSRDR
jgi:hypothetical protein